MYKSNYRHLLWFLLFFTLFSSPSTVFCQSDKEPVKLNAIIVTAEKEEESFQTGDVDKEQSPAFFSVISRDQFEGKVEDISEIIEKEAGIQVRQRGGLGGFSTISLRGASSEQVLIYLDGILLNDASGGGVDLSNISLSDIESIEIYRGVSPVNFGKASIGGVVNIKTLRSKKGFNANIGAGYGSFHTEKLSGFINHKPGIWDYLISVDYLSSDNDFDMLNDNGTTFNTNDDFWEERHNAQFEQYDVLAKAGFDFAETMRLEAVNQWFNKDQGLPSWNNSRNTKTSFGTTRNISTIALTADDITPFHLNTKTSLNYTYKNEEYDDSEGHIGLGQQHSEYRTDRYGIDFFMEWFTDYQSLSLAVAYQHETYSTEELLQKQNPMDSERDMIALALQDTVSLFGDVLMITPGLRYTYYDDELKSATSAWGLPLAGQSRTEDYLSPQLGVKYVPLDWLTLKSNIAQYVREPSFFELFGDRGYFTGNPDLNAEKGINFDAGIETQWRPVDRWIQRISMASVYFFSDIEDLITRSYDSRGIGRSENISQAYINGVELNVRVDFLDYFRITGNATFQDTENQSSNQSYNGKKLPGRFEKSYFGRFEAFYRGFKLYAEYHIEKDMYYDTPNLLKAEDKEEINGGLSYMYKDITASVEAKNINDDQYEEFNGYPSPGRSYFMSIKYNF